MKVTYSATDSAQHGEPTWRVDEEDRPVSHVLRLSDLAKPTEDERRALAIRRVRQAITHTITWRNEELAAFRLDEAGRLRAMTELPVPDGTISHIQWLLIVAADAARQAKPGDRSMADRGYAVLLTDLERALAWARLKEL